MKKLSPNEKSKMVKEWIKDFVNSLEGRFNEHMSNAALGALLYQNLINLSYANQSRFTVFLDKERKSSLESLLYPVGSIAFERILEHGCKAICNGHHVTQLFIKFMVEKLEEFENDQSIE